MTGAVVIGGGTMGAGIAALLAAAGHAVDLVEDGETASLAALARSRAQLAEAERRRRLPVGETTERALARIEPRAALDCCAGRPTLVVEAVPEQIELKRHVLAAAEALGPSLLATNTSGIAIEKLAPALRRPDRLIGLHFFNPVLAMDLVEGVTGVDTTDEARSQALALVTALSKTAIVVASAPGFATSRLGVALALEAIRMLGAGIASADDIDRAMTLGYRHPVGPLRLTDIVGLDVRLDIARNLHREYGERFAPPALLEELIAAGRLGRKVGHGFYRWEIT